MTIVVKYPLFTQRSNKTRREQQRSSSTSQKTNIIYALRYYRFSMITECYFSNSAWPLKYVVNHQDNQLWLFARLQRTLFLDTTALKEYFEDINVTHRFMLRKLAKTHLLYAYTPLLPSIIDFGTDPTEGKEDCLPLIIIWAEDSRYSQDRRRQSWCSAEWTNFSYIKWSLQCVYVHGYKHPTT